MEHLINSRVKNIEISGIRKFFNLVSQFDDVISLTIGQPDFYTPEHIKNYATKAIKENFTTYTPNAGIMEVRKAATEFMKQKYNLDYNFENEVITTVGASQAIDITFRTILTEGSEVILPGPVYPGYEPLIKLCGAKAVFADTRESDFKLTASIIEKYITTDTRCIVLPYPSNPTGVTLSQEEIMEIACLLKGKEIFIISDEIYSELVFEGNHHSIASHLREQTIVINGLSKSHSMTGWRIGFTFAPEDITKHMLKVHQYNVSCASSISQKAAGEALTNGLNDALPMKQEYQSRLDYVYNRLVELGISVVKPNGAFYLFPSIEKYNLSSFEFASKLLEEVGLAVVPGDAFSEYGEGYIRISYAYSIDTLTEGMNRLEAFVRRLETNKI
ncbi:aminotransferase A [Litchfieldia alkalitelluris]|uniref:aminotransferase A n=1 Tax=Litchfieldia alkalitelluris TaxID=304268 RepID=UPI000996FDC1|nr:aminotransferase A [Litchfieldia alkalitelluris]